MLYLKVSDIAINNVKFIKIMQFKEMFVTAVSVYWNIVE